MKVERFSSFEEFEDANITGEYETIAIVNRNQYVCADAFTECKNYKTAVYNNPFKASVLSYWSLLFYIIKLITNNP